MLVTERHDTFLGVLTKFLYVCHILYDTSHISLDNLKLDLVIKYNNSCYFVEILIPYDSIINLESSANRKIEKYRQLIYVSSLCYSSLRSWYSGKQILKIYINVPSNTWKTLKTDNNTRFWKNFIVIFQLFLKCFIILLGILSCIISILFYSQH